MCRQCGSIMKKMYPVFPGIVLNILLNKLKIPDKPPKIHIILRCVMDCSFIDRN